MKLLLLFAVSGCALAQPPDLEQILSRLARNQAKSLDARKDWIYNQKQLLRMIRGNGKLAREEHREYLIVPKPRGVHKELASFTGKYGINGKEVAYDKPKFQYKGTDIDGEILDGMSNDMTNDGNSRDGISHDLLPLTFHQQLTYDCNHKVTEPYKSGDVYRVPFYPKPRRHGDDDGMVWRREVLIDAVEYQPVSIHTTLAWKMPMAVKILLGTDIRGLGFSVEY